MASERQYCAVNGRWGCSLGGCPVCAPEQFGQRANPAPSAPAASGEPSDGALIVSGADAILAVSRALTALHAELEEARHASEQAVAEANRRDAKWMAGVLDACKPTIIAFDGMPSDALQPPNPTLHDFVAALRQQLTNADRLASGYKKDLGAARGSIAVLRAEVEAGRRDTARLDWLECQNAKVGGTILPPTCGYSVRAYIDARLTDEPNPKSAATLSTPISGASDGR